MKVENIKYNQNLIEQVVQLGTLNSKTLGHFPEGAFIEYAKKGNIVCAYDAGNLLGYILFSITSSKRTLRIVHLCIKEDFRNRGLAKLLLDHLKVDYSLILKGISLSCREDYLEANKFWKKYGFKPKDRIRSRSKKENYLIRWWYDFGNHDLFSLSNAYSEKPKALLDANILIKLRERNIEDSTGVKFLLADWLIDLIEYYYAPEIYNEILRDNDKNRAAKTRSFLTEFNEAKFKPSVRDHIFTDINNMIIGSSENDISDKRQLAECIASEMEYFITTDINILDSDEKIFEKYGVRVVRPTDFILLVDQLNNKSNYYSTRIAGVSYEYKPLLGKEIDLIVDIFLRRDKGEKKHIFRDLITSIASNIQHCKIKVVQDNNNSKVGCWGAKTKNESISIPIIRTLKSNISATLFKQLVFEAINYTISKGKRILEISDKYLNETEQETLETLGFILKREMWTKFTLRDIVNSEEFILSEKMPQEFFNKKNILEKIDTNISFKFGLERFFWPLKFSDLNIPTYIIPIKPHWASQLFDYYMANSSLFGSLPELAWNNENIYYRSVNPVSEKSPARILWYSSSATNEQSGRTKGIVACSYLDDVKVGKVKDLFSQFRNYGIYAWKDVYKLAKNDIENEIKALSFSNTEVFKNIIPINKVNGVLLSNGRKKNTFASPLEVDNNIFIELYKLGIELK